MGEMTMAAARGSDGGVADGDGGGGGGGTRRVENMKRARKEIPMPPVPNGAATAERMSATTAP